jgi:hypothetical protein
MKVTDLTTTDVKTKEKGKKKNKKNIDDFKNKSDTDLIALKGSFSKLDKNSQDALASLIDVLFAVVNKDN